MQRLTLPRLALLSMVLLSLPMAAQEASQSGADESVSRQITLKDAAQAAVLKSPEVLARWHAFREASEETGVAKGGFLPRLDLSAATFKERTLQRDVNTDLSYSGNEASLTLRQMLFDGFATSSEVKRLGKAKLVRYYELLDASENTALEAGRAYLDVARYRAQTELAEDNYIQHQAAYDQLKKRAESGVGKRVDVDQAASRLALADVNLTTAYANLHDVMARYVRIVGEQPPKSMPASDNLSGRLPASSEAALSEALKNNPALRASIENTEAAQYDLEGRRAAFMPRVDLIARRDQYSNYQDAGSRDDTRVELRLNYNLFNGGSDLARNRQYRERKDMALDLREKACRDMRQTVSIAFNDTLRLNDQLSYIGQQVKLVEKTRAAYRDQFNIGQRTLLDLLNTQNEYFDARRAQINADADLTLAYLRSYAGMGRLLETLGLKRVDSENVPDENELSPVDFAQLCPATVPIAATLDREALARKVKAMQDNPNSGLLGNRPQAVGNTLVATVPPADGAARATDSIEAEISIRTTAWAAAWASRDVKGYLGFYSSAFKPEGGLSRADWARQREQRIGKSNGIRVEIQEPVALSNGPDSAVSTFRQIYTTDTYGDTSNKTLEWRKENGQWLIVRERASVAQKAD